MKKLTVLLLFIAVALTGVTLHLVRELRASRAQAQALAGQLEELQRARLARTPFMPAPQPAPAPVEEAPPPAVPSVAPPAPAAQHSPAPPVREERMAAMRASRERQLALLQDPGYREAMLTQYKATLSQSYPELMSELNLSREQADAFFTLLADQQLRAMENQEAFPTDPADAGARQAMQQKMEAWRQTTEQELTQLLGPDTAQAWRQYQSTLGARHEVRQLGSALASAGVPLRDDQIKPLRAAFAESQRRMAEQWSRDQQLQPGLAAGGRPSAADMLAIQERSLQVRKESNAALREMLAPVLTPEQLHRFDEQREAQLKMNEAQLRMMRARAEAEARGDLPPMQSEPALLSGGNYFAPGP